MSNPIVCICNVYFLEGNTRASRSDHVTHPSHGEELRRSWKRSRYTETVDNKYGGSVIVVTGSLYIGVTFLGVPGILSANFIIRVQIIF